MDELVAISSFDTQMQTIDRSAVRIQVRCNTDNSSILHIQIQLTANAAIRACSLHKMVGATCGDGHLIIERACWTVCYTCAARFATRCKHGRVIPRNDPRLIAAIRLRPDEASLYLGTGTHTTIALDALVAIHQHKRIGIAIHRVTRRFRHCRDNIHVIFLRKTNQIIVFINAAFPVHALVACIIVIGKQHTQDGTSITDHGGSIRSDAHLRSNRCVAGCHRQARILHLHHTNSTSTKRTEILVIAQCWNSECQPRQPHSEWLCSLSHRGSYRRF